MSNETDRRGSLKEAPQSPEAAKMERFYEAYKYLEFHPIFNVTPGEKVDLTSGKLLSGGVGLDLSDESLKAFPVEIHRFDLALDIDIVKVNPETGEIDDDPTKNTKVQVWLEAGPYEDLGITDGYGEPTSVKGFSHDVELDSGGDTFEDAIIELAERVRAKYDSPQSPQESLTS